MAVSLRYVGRVAYKPCLVLQEKLAEKYVDKQQPKVRIDSHVCDVIAAR